MDPGDLHPSIQHRGLGLRVVTSWTDQSPRHIAAAVIAKDNLEFLDDTIPKTQPYKEIKQKAAETRAKLQGGKPAGEQGDESGLPNGKRQKSLNGFGVHDVVKKSDEAEGPRVDPTDGDVQMTG